VSNDNVFALKNPGVANEVRDALTEVLREGRGRFGASVEAEVVEFLGRHRGERDSTERARLVRNGYLPERTIQTGVGAVPVQAPVQR
jgi:putative transposase